MTMLTDTITLAGQDHRVLTRFTDHKRQGHTLLWGMRLVGSYALGDIELIEPGLDTVEIAKRRLTKGGYFKLGGSDFEGIVSGTPFYHHDKGPNVLWAAIPVMVADTVHVEHFEDWARSAGLTVDIMQREAAKLNAIRSEAHVFAAA